MPTNFLMCQSIKLAPLSKTFSLCSNNLMAYWRKKRPCFREDLALSSEHSGILYCAEEHQSLFCSASGLCHKGTAIIAVLWVHWGKSRGSNSKFSFEWEPCKKCQFFPQQQSCFWHIGRHRWRTLKISCILFDITYSAF